MLEFNSRSLRPEILEDFLKKAPSKAIKNLVNFKIKFVSMAVLQQCIAHLFYMHYSFLIMESACMNLLHWWG